MNEFLSENEIVVLYKEYKKKSNGVKNIDIAIAEIITIKLNSLIKNVDLSINNYIDKFFNISSLCDDIDLNQYNIKDTQIFFTLKENVLSGYIYRSNSNKESDSFISVIKVKNSLILWSKINVESSVFFKKLLKENNIVCADTYLPKAKENLKKKFIDSIKDRIFYNMFIESQFRKDETGYSQFDDKDIKALVSTYGKKFSSKGIYVEDAIFNSLRGYIENRANTLSTKILSNVSRTSPYNITNMDYLYNELFINMDDLIINYLNKVIRPSKNQKGKLIIVDLLLIKDILNERESKKKVISDILNDLESIYKKLFSEIENNIYKRLKPISGGHGKIFINLKAVFNINNPKTFDVYIDGNRFSDCISLNITEKTIIINQTKYLIPQIYFKDSSNKRFLINPLEIKKFLTLKVGYNDTIIYSVSDTIKHLIMDFESKIAYLTSNTMKLL